MESGPEMVCVIVDLATYRKVRGWFDGLYNPQELKAIMRFMMTAPCEAEAAKLQDYYKRAR